MSPQQGYQKRGEPYRQAPLPKLPKVRVPGDRDHCDDCSHAGSERCSYPQGPCLLSREDHATPVEDPLARAFATEDEVSHYVATHLNGGRRSNSIRELFSDE